MPTINLNKKLVLKLADLKMSDAELRDKISFLGTDLEEINKDEIIVEIFPNRPDLLSAEGFARALSSFCDKKTGLRKYEKKKSEYVVNIKKDVNLVRPHTACAVVKGLKITDEVLEDIIEIQEKLHLTYGRNRKRCAIGVYPLEVVKFPITYTALTPNKIKFVPLDSNREMNGLQILQKHEKGREYAHLLEGKSKFPIFIDANKEILSMPPVINSEKTGKVKYTTTEMFVECSGFEFHVVSKALNMLLTAFSDMGAKIYEVTLKYDGTSKKVSTPEINAKKMNLSVNYVNKYIGSTLKSTEIIKSLKKMGFDVTKGKKDDLSVLVPCYRADILHQIDLVEDVSIGYGYNNIKEIDKRVYNTGKEAYPEKVKRKIRDIFAGHGLIETYTLSLYNLKEQEKIFPKKEIVKITNSVSAEYNSMRCGVILSLLKTLKNNKQYEYPQNIFETGKTFLSNNKEETTVEENDTLGVLFCSEYAGFTKAKQHLDSLFEGLNLKYSIEKNDSKIFMKGRSGKIIFEKEIIGEIGEVDPALLSDFQIEMPTSGFEIKLNKLFSVLKKLNEVL